MEEKLKILNSQLEEKEQQLEEYISNIKNNYLSDEAENLRKEIYDLVNKINILNDIKERQEINEDLKIVEELRKELGLSADGNKIKQGQELARLIEQYERQKEVLKNVYREANNVLYLDDSSDYCYALWEILKIINPDLKESNIKNSVSKDKIKEILDNKFVIHYEGDAEFPDYATEIHAVKYIKAKYIEELLEGDEYMTEEEKEATERLKKGVNDIWFGTLYSQEEEDEDIRIILNLIQKQQKYIEDANDITADMNEAIKKLIAEIEIKEKIIDRMAGEIHILSDDSIKYCDGKSNGDCEIAHCKDCIIEFFEKKVGEKITKK